MCYLDRYSVFRNIWLQCRVNCIVPIGLCLRCTHLLLHVRVRVHSLAIFSSTEDMIYNQIDRYISSELHLHTHSSFMGGTWQYKGNVSLKWCCDETNDDSNSSLATDDWECSVGTHLIERNTASANTMLLELLLFCWLCCSQMRC